MGDFWIEGGERILFIGDSITDCGRRERAIPLGDGYVSIFAEFVTARYPERNIEWINMGIGGNRTTHLKERWQSDVIEHSRIVFRSRLESTISAAFDVVIRTASRLTYSRETTIR